MTTYPSLFNTDPYQRKTGQRKLIRDMPQEDQPLNRIAHAGPRAVSNTELLAALLQTKDALDLSEEILANTGGLHNLPKTTTAQLTSIKGLATNQTLRIKSAIEIGRRLMLPTSNPYPKIHSPADTYTLLYTKMAHLEQEHLVAVLLDARNQILSIPTIAIGTIDSTQVRVADIFKYIVRANASRFILSHNHPSGDPSPSPEDVSITKQISKASELMDVDFLDHIIIGNQRYVSLSERQLMQ